MKKIAATTLLAACSLLGAGCSDSTVESTAASAVATPSPVQLTDEERRAIALSADANKAAEKKKKEEAAKADAVAAPEVPEIKAVEPTDSLVKPTP
jgi:hypothetical protein